MATENSLFFTYPTLYWNRFWNRTSDRRNQNQDLSDETVLIQRREWGNSLLLFLSASVMHFILLILKLDKKINLNWMNTFFLTFKPRFVFIRTQITKLNHSLRLWSVSTFRFLSSDVVFPPPSPPSVSPLWSPLFSLFSQSFCWFSSTVALVTDWLTASPLVHQSHPVSCAGTGSVLCLDTVSWFPPEKRCCSRSLRENFTFWNCWDGVCTKTVSDFTFFKLSYEQFQWNTRTNVHKTKWWYTNMKDIL